MIKNNIYIVSPTESELTSRGKRHPNLANYLSNKGWEVNYISTDFNHSEKRLFSKKEYSEAIQKISYKLTLLNVGLYDTNVSPRRVLWNQRFAYKCYLLLSQLLHGGDILIVPSRPPELIYVATLLKRQKKCRIILDIRDIWPDALTESSGLSKFVFSTYCNLFLNKSVNRYDSFIHVAPSFLNWLQRYAPEKNQHLFHWVLTNVGGGRKDNNMF